MAKVIPSVYRIDPLKIKALLAEGTRYSAIKAHEKINERHQATIRQTESSAKPFTLLSEQVIGHYKVAIYGTRNDSKPHKWKNLFPEPLENLNVQYPNLAAFFSYNGECYAISSGMGHTLFEQFIDVNFPLDIARRIMSPRLDSTTERDITGSVYGRQQQFRSAQRIISSQNLGTVWQAIKGDIVDDVKASQAFIEIFEPDRAKISVDAGSSLTIRRSIEIAKFEKLLDWLQPLRTQRLTNVQKEAFKFLEGLKEVSSRKNAARIDTIKLSLASQILAAINGHTAIDLDFSHKKYPFYQSARSYSIASPASDEIWESAPTADDVFGELTDHGLIDTGSAGELLASLEKTDFIAENENTIESTRASVLNHLHGEIQQGSNTYFLIDGKYYFAEGSFLKRVKDDFKTLIVGEHFSNNTSLVLENFSNSSQSEGRYNESYIGKDNWLVTDRQLMDNVEISDLLHWTDENLFIIHNKIDFGASVRDVCSQILMSMQIMNQAIDAKDLLLLGDYYDRIKAKYYVGLSMPIERQAFLNKLMQIDKSKIVYVVGYAQASPVTGSSKSNIAKFESLKLCHQDSKPFGFILKFIHITRS